MAVTFVIGNAYKISAGLFEPGNSIASALANEFNEAADPIAPRVADRARAGAVRAHLHRARAVADADRPAGQGRGQADLRGLPTCPRRLPQQSPSGAGDNAALPAAPALNRFNLVLSMAAMAFGMIFLLWILVVLFGKGFAALSPTLFTQMTPPPGSEGGLANAIFGSLVIVGAATFISTPIGILAGIYLAEFGKDGWVARVTRFINDILLSAPSIVIGLFVYTVYVAPVQHFSGWAGLGRAGADRGARGRAHDREHAAPGARPACARPRSRWARRCGR